MKRATTSFTLQRVEVNLIQRLDVSTNFLVRRVAPDVATFAESRGQEGEVIRF